MSVAEVAAGLHTGGYYADPEVAQAVAGVLLPRPDRSLRALLITGAPGTGKSALAHAVGRMTDAPVITYQFHNWTDADELFVGVSVPAAVAGDAANVRQSGALLLATKASLRGQVVLLLDEVDKAPERAECLLLDWLQSGRCPVAPGVHSVANPRNLLVIMTSNGKREIGEALRRRVRLLQISKLSRQAWCSAVASMVPTIGKDAISLVYREISRYKYGKATNEPAPASVAAFLTEVIGICGTCDSMQSAWRAHVLPAGTSSYDGIDHGVAGSLWAAIVAARKVGT